MTPPLENTYWVTPGKFLAGEYPGHWSSEEAAKRIEILEANGVGLFIDLTQKKEPLEPYNHLLKTAEYRRMPIVDASVPSPAHMIKILDGLDEALSQGIIPYVHCWGGIGRTGTTVGCWLARHDRGGKEGLQELKRLWQNCAKSFYTNSPETLKQEEFILNWQAGD